MSRKVRANASYYYAPVPLDLIHNKAPNLSQGDLVKVVNLPGAPKCNTMGQCHVELNGKFAGMVCTNSLIPPKDWPEYQRLLEEQAKELAQQQAK